MLNHIVWPRPSKEVKLEVKLDISDSNSPPHQANGQIPHSPSTNDGHMPRFAQGDVGALNWSVHLS